MTVFHVVKKEAMTEAGVAQGTQKGKEAALLLNAPFGFKITDVCNDTETGETLFVTDVPMPGSRLVVLHFADLAFIAPRD